jgi:cellulose biosynthesis protein BcsQ
MRTIAVIARKGGSGKSTVALHIALAAHLRGRKVLLADTDAQRSATHTLKGRLAAGPALADTSGAKLGRSVEELDPPAEAAREMVDIWAFVEGFLFGRQAAERAG